MPGRQRSCARGPRSWQCSSPGKLRSVWTGNLAAETERDRTAIEPSEWLGGVTAAEFPPHLVSSQPHYRLHSQMVR
jgi:hypothetical protein